MRLDVTHHKHFCSYAWERTSVVSAEGFISGVWKANICTTCQSNTLRYCRTKPAGQLRERSSEKRAEGEQDKKRGRIQRGGEERKGAEETQEAQLTLGPHLSFSALSIAALIPLFHSLTSLCPTMPSGWFRPCRPGHCSGGVRRMEVEVLTVPVGDQIICDTVSPFPRCSSA